MTRESIRDRFFLDHPVHGNSAGVGVNAAETDETPEVVYAGTGRNTPSPCSNGYSPKNRRKQIDFSIWNEEGEAPGDLPNRVRRRKNTSFEPDPHAGSTLKCKLAALKEGGAKAGLNSFMAESNMKKTTKDLTSRPSRTTIYSQGNSLSPVPISRQSGHPIGGKRESLLEAPTMTTVPEGLTDFSSGGMTSPSGPRTSLVSFSMAMPLAGDAKQRRSLLGVQAMAPVSGDLKGIRRGSQGNPRRRRSWLKKHWVKFEGHDHSRPLETSQSYTDKAALDRAWSGWQSKVQSTPGAILHARDSLITTDSVLRYQQLALLTTSVSQGSTMQAEPNINESHSARAEHASPSSRSAVLKHPEAVRALRRLPVFSDCSDYFLNLIVSESEQLTMKAGEVREVGGAQTGSGRSLAAVVQSGTWRVEIGGKSVVDECIAGSAFGLANVFAGVHMGSRRNVPGMRTVDDFVMRALLPGPDGSCKYIVICTSALRRALADCPADQAQLREVIHMVNRPVDATQPLLNVLQCSEPARAAIEQSSTRNIYMPGEVICTEGKRSPDGLIYIRSGVVELEINNVEVRRVSEGQTIGEELLFGVTNVWATTVRSGTACDLQVLHRRHFIHFIHELQNGPTESKSESQRLLFLLEGRWKEEKVILSWPLFRGYHEELLRNLKLLIELRVALPGGKLWDGSAAAGSETRETALHCLLYGTCDEASTAERYTKKDVSGLQESRRVKRVLTPGALFGAHVFLGFLDAQPMVVTARTLCMVAVLHRSVFLHCLDKLTHKQKELQSPEVVRLLEEDLSRNEIMSQTDHAQLVSGLPMFRGMDKRFVEVISSKVARRLCIVGQRLCSAGEPADLMFVLSRGDVCMTMEGLQIKRYDEGAALNVLALAAEAFVPSFTVSCECTCEFWSLSRNDFTLSLVASPVEKAKLSALIKAPLKSLQAVKDPSRHEEDNVADATQKALITFEVFSRCSTYFLYWVQQHLETTMFFPNEVLVREGDDNRCMYIICQGTVIMEGSSTQHSQVSLGPGSSFGELRLLGVSEQSAATCICVEATIVQVLHHCIFHHGAGLFPEEVPHFEDFALAQLSAKNHFSLAQVPFFGGCSPHFCYHVERLMKTRLINQGGVIIEEGATSANLCVLRTGSCVVEDSSEQSTKPGTPGTLPYASGSMTSMNSLSSHGTGRQTLAPSALGQHHASLVGIFTRCPQRLSVHATMNAELVLGTVLQAPATIKAEKVCSVAEIGVTTFLNVLQRFPTEITRLLQAVLQQSTTSAGIPRLWPHEAELVPLLHGVTSQFFNELMEATEWHMLLPNQYIVRQGQVGEKLYILCYGQALTELDGIVIGSELSAGDCIGKGNFFGFRAHYLTSVRTKVVSHFRSVTPKVLEKVLDRNAAVVERIEQIKQQVKKETSEEAREQQEQVSVEKLRRREQGAFRSHISSVRNVRGVAPINLTPAQSQLLEAMEAKFAGRKTGDDDKDGESGRKSARNSALASARSSTSSSRHPSAHDEARDWVSLRNKWKDITPRTNPKNQTARRTSNATVRPGSLLVKRIAERKSIGSANHPSKSGSPLAGSRATVGASPRSRGTVAESPRSRGTVAESPRSRATVAEEPRRSSLWQDRSSDSASEDEESPPPEDKPQFQRRPSILNAAAAMATKNHSVVASMVTGRQKGRNPSKGSPNSSQSNATSPKGRASKAKARNSAGSLLPGGKRISALEASPRKMNIRKVLHDNPFSAKKMAKAEQMHHEHAKRASSKEQLKRRSRASHSNSGNSGTEGTEETESDSDSSVGIDSSGASSGSDGAENQPENGCLKVLITDIGVPGGAGDSGSGNTLEAVAEDSPSMAHHGSAASLLGGKTIEQIFYAKMNELNVKRPLSKVERIEAAISMHIGARQRAMARGKVLRALHSGMPIETAIGEEELEEIQDWLMSDDSSHNSEQGDVPEEAEEDPSSTTEGSGHPATKGDPDEALRSKFRQLVGSHRRQPRAKSAFG